jgi:hypothetical protein
MGSTRYAYLRSPRAVPRHGDSSYLGHTLHNHFRVPWGDIRERWRRHRLFALRYITVDTMEDGCVEANTQLGKQQMIGTGPALMS